MTPRSLARSLAPAIAALLLAAALPSCKPNETAYRAAYETALAKRDAETVADTTGIVAGTIYNQYRDMARTTTLPLGSDTLKVTTEFVKVTEGIPADSLQRYGVVVGRFKQIFNAREMDKRLRSLGYDNAFIVETREPLYYNVVGTTDMAVTALEELRRVQADKNLVLRQPLPFVLESARHRR